MAVCHKNNGYTTTMAGKGGIRSTSFKSGANPVRQTGSKNKRTILKEKMGLQNWNTLTDFIENDGAGKMVTEMKKLTGKNYVIAYGILAEFVKPKLARVTVAGDKDAPINFQLLTVDPLILPDDTGNDSAT